MRERSGMCMWRPAICVAALGMLVVTGSAFGGATIEFRPVFTSGASSISGTNVDLDHDNQYVIVEVYARDWDNGPDTGMCIEADGTNSGTVCSSIADCNPNPGPLPGSWQTCGPGVEVYEMGLDCAEFDNGTGSIHTPSNGFECFVFDNSFCTGVDTSRADWAFDVSAGVGSGCNPTEACPGGEATDVWFKCGGIRTNGRAPDSGEQGEIYLITFAIDVPAGAKGLWTIGPDQDGPGPYVFQVNTTANIWIDTVIPATINLPIGKCCGASGPGAVLECIDGVTLSECTGIQGSAANKWFVGESCSGADVAPTDGIDDACPACESNADCNDGDACTQDLCDIPAGECSNPDNLDLDRNVNCCSPTTGVYAVIDDGDTCTADSCDQATGLVSNDLQIGLACDDGNDCSTADNCRADGSCAGTQVNDLVFACNSLDECRIDFGISEATGCEDIGLGLQCVCSLCTPLTLDVRDGQHADPNCHDEGEPVVIDVNMGAGSQLAAGAQWLITWDTSCLAYGWVDIGGDFPLLLAIEENADSIFIAQRIDVFGGGLGTTGPANLATLHFTKQAGCAACNACFISVNPRNTILSNDEGNAIEICTGSDCSKDIRLAGVLSIDTPENVFTNPDCDSTNAIVTFGDTTVSDTCDGAPTLDCVSSHDGGLDVSGLMANGGVFPQGESIFWCTATNDCGDVVEEYWTVDVSAQHTMDVEVQLSPWVDDGPFTRCICFEFFADCAGAPMTWCDDMVFGGDYEWTGHSNKTVKVPKGQYACLTARDPLHTLRAVSGIDCVGNVLVATFKGDPDLGGNWLVGGNLDALKPGGGADTIDIRDFGVFVTEFAGGVTGANTPCGSASPHGDINGDGMVDTDDFIFISENFLMASKNSCCDDGRVAPEDAMESITVKELRRLGMGDLAVADLNGDGVLDQADMVMALQGNLPPRSVKTLRSTRSLRD